MSTARDFYANQKPLLVARPLTVARSPVTRSPARQRAVTPPPPLVVPVANRTVATQLQIDALSKKATAAFRDFMIFLGCCVFIFLAEHTIVEEYGADRPWFVRVENHYNNSLSTLHSSMHGVFPATYRSEFSLQKFFTSWLGWLVISACIGSVCKFAMYAKYTAAAKEITGRNKGTVC